MTTPTTPIPAPSPDLWTIGYMAGLRDVFQRIAEIEHDSISVDTVELDQLRRELIEKLGLSDDAKRLLNLPL
jgi:hypothetical protein